MSNASLSSSTAGTALFPLLCSLSSSQGCKEVGQVPRLPPCGTALSNSHWHWNGTPTSDPTSPGTDRCQPRAASDPALAPSRLCAVPITAPSSPITSREAALVSPSSHFSGHLVLLRALHQRLLALLCWEAPLSLTPVPPQPALAGCEKPPPRQQNLSSLPAIPMPTSRHIPSKPSGSPSPAARAPRPASIPCCRAASSAPFSVSIHFLQLPRSATRRFPPAPLQLSSPISATAAQGPQAGPCPLGERRQPPAQLLPEPLLLPPTLIFPAQPRGGMQPAAHVTWQHHQPSLATGAQHPAERGDTLQQAGCGQAGQGQAASPRAGRRLEPKPARSAWGQSATACLIRHREKFNKLLSAFRWERASTAAPLPAPSPPPPGATPHTREMAEEDSRAPGAMVPGGMSRSVPQLCRASLPPLPAQPAALCPSLPAHPPALCDERKA